MIAADTKATIVNAPEGFVKSFGPFGLNGKSMAFVNGMIIVSTRIGEFILKLPEGLHITPGLQLNMKLSGEGDVVFMSSPNESRKPAVRPVPADDGEELPRVVPSRYFEATKHQPSVLTGHNAASSAAFDGAVRSGSREDAFTSGRAIALVPDLVGDRSAAILLTFLLVSMARGGSESWLGSSKEVSDAIWTIALRESAVEISGMGKWTVRQFPIEGNDGTIWALFAVPEVKTGRVSRFIIEIPTKSLGLVQIKGFGSDATCEIVVNTAIEASQVVKAAIMAAINAVAEHTGADISINIVNDEGMLANLSAARRINLGA